jgi:hypothetical protein
MKLRKDAKLDWLSRFDWTIYLLVVILLLSFSVRIARMNETFMVGDAWNFISWSVEGGGLQLSHGHIGPLRIGYGTMFLTLCTAFLKLWSDHILGFFIFSYIMWSLSAIMIYKIGRDFFSKPAGLVSAALFTFSSFSVFSTAYNVNGTFIPFFMALFVYSLMKIKFHDSMRYWFFLSVSVAFLLSIHVSAFIAPFAILIFLLFKPRFDLKNIALGLLFLVISFAPYMYGVFAENNMGEVLEYIFVGKSSLASGFTGIMPLMLSPVDYLFTDIFLVSLMAGLVFLSYVYMSCCKEKKKCCGMPAGDMLKKYILLILLILVFFVWLKILTYDSFYSYSALFVLYCIVIGAFLGMLVERLKKRKLFFIVICLYIFLASWCFFSFTGGYSFLRSYENQTEQYGIEQQLADIIMNQTGTITGHKLNRSEWAQIENLDIYHFSKMSDKFLGTRYKLLQSGWQPTENQSYYMIDGLPYQDILSDFNQDMPDGSVFLIMKDVTSDYIFSSSAENGWQSSSFDDSEWIHYRNEMAICDFKTCFCLNEKNYGANSYMRIFLDDSVEGNHAQSALMIKGDRGKFIINDVYVNGILLENISREPVESYVIYGMESLLKDGQNLIAFNFSETNDCIVSKRLVLFKERT